ncbi:hypothetical protein BH09BAC1_BH09BAC1_01030 [soil metagenome]
MKFYSKLILSVLVLLVTTSQMSAQLLLLEDFENGIPATWIVRDVDGKTPDPDVAGLGFGVGDAWIGVPEGIINGDGNPNGVALSHSWYTPVAASNDWLISPPIALGTTTDLIWKAQTFGSAAFRDGYEVRISTTDTTIAAFLANPALFTIAAENNGWNSHTVNLAAYANQTVYIAFRNNSFDKYLLALDDVIVIDGPFLDGKIVGTIHEYGLAPLDQINTVAFNDLAVINLGTGPLTNVYGRVLVAYDGNIIAADSTAPIGSVAVGDTVALNFTGSFSVTDTGEYLFLVTLHSTLDVIGANDTLFSVMYVNDSVFGRDNGQISGATLGIGYQAPDTVSPGGYLGQTYALLTRKVLTSVTAGFSGFTEGDSTSVAVLEITNGVPGATIAESNVHVFGPAGNIDVVDFVFPSNVVLQADTYLIVAREYSEYLGLLTTPNLTPNTTFVQFPVGAAMWFNNEDVGFDVSYAIRANFGPCTVTIDSSYVKQPNCPNSLDAEIIVYATANQGALTYLWSTGATTANVDFLTTGTYTVTVGDGLGCETVVTYNLSGGTPITGTITATNATTETATDGSATVTATGGTAPLTYAWSRGGSTTATATGLAVGQIKVTVTDAKGCEKTLTDTIGFGVGLFNLTNDLSAKIYPNPASKQVFVEVTLHKAGDVEIVVMNNLGQAVIRQTNAAAQVVNVALNISSFPSGIYLVQITSGDASTTQKLIVE